MNCKHDALKIKFKFNGVEDTLYPVIIQDGNELILIDCGYEGFLPLIEEAAKNQNIDISRLTGIVITHHDIDHMGALCEFKEKYPPVKVYSSAVEKKYISGKEKSLRLIQAEELFPSLPEDQKEGALGFQKFLQTMKHVEVDCVFKENEIMPWGGGVEIISTPGHMPGHISLYIRESKTLIAADAIVYERDEFNIANPHFTLDITAALESVRKIAGYEIKEVVCYHGGVVKDNIQERLQELISKYS